MTPEIKEKYAELPWPQIIAMRNRLIHGYDSVDYDILWDTIKEDIPHLISSLEEVINEI